MRAGKYVSRVSECNYEKEQVVSSLLAISRDSFFLLSPFVSFSSFFFLCVSMCACVTIPLGSRQNSFSADTSFFLSFFFSKCLDFQRGFLPDFTAKSLIWWKYRFLPLWKKERKSERMNELGSGNITCICTTMHCYPVRFFYWFCALIALFLLDR